MRRATSVVRAGDWQGPAIDTVTLDFDARYRRRFVHACDSGGDVMIDLARAQALADGDGLVTDEGVVAVRAADEDLAEVRCADTAHLVRVAWHLGNRHLPTELAGEVIRIRRDHVIEDMLVKLGAEVVHVRAPFNPEGGAYGEGRTHGHGHDDDHGHDHHHHHHHDHE